MEGATPAYLLLGTNLGRREEFLSLAKEAIGEKAGRIVAESSVYQTEPWGTEGQPLYLNQALILETRLSPGDLLREVLQIETALGRVRDGHWGNRTIDIDILYYGSLVMNDGELEIPHPRLHLRNFALYPLNEIAPDYIHPVLKKSNRLLLTESSDPLPVHKW